MRVCRYCGQVAPDPRSEPICHRHPDGLVGPHSYEEARPGAIHSTPTGSGRCPTAASWTPTSRSEPPRANASSASGSPRYAVKRVDNRQWGGIQWAIWDRELQTWADDIGRFLTEDAASRALAKHEAGERQCYWCGGWFTDPREHSCGNT